MNTYITSTTLGLWFWLRFSKDENAIAYKELTESGFFSPNFILGSHGSLCAFDLTNGIFLRLQEKPDKGSDRCITLVEYELFRTYSYHSNNVYSFHNFYFHLKSHPMITIMRPQSSHVRGDRFISILDACNQSIVDATRKPGYHEWREKMKRKGWLIDREVDNQIMAQRRGEQILEIVPLEELEGTSNMLGR